jgi:hypothetical protein
MTDDRSPLAALDVGATRMLLDELAKEERKKADIYRESTRLHVSGDVSNLVAKYDVRAALLDAASAALPALVADRERLDWLQEEALADPLLLHNGRPGVSVNRTAGEFRGLGMLDGRRTLREAVDAARSVRPAGDAPEGKPR